MIQGRKIQPLADLEKRLFLTSWKIYLILLTKLNFTFSHIILSLSFKETPPDHSPWAHFYALTVFLTPSSKQWLSNSQHYPVNKPLIISNLKINFHFFLIFSGFGGYLLVGWDD